MPRRTRAQRARKHNRKLDATENSYIQDTLKLSVETDRTDCLLRELRRAHIKELSLEVQLRELPLGVQHIILKAHTNLPLQRYLALRDTVVEGTATEKKKLQDFWGKLAPDDREHVHQLTDNL